MAERLSDHTTLRLGGPARSWLRATTSEELVDAVRRCDEAGEPVLVLAGGSNLVVADDGFDGTVVEVATTGVAADHDGDRHGHQDGDHATCGGVVVTAAAGESWEPLVEQAVEHGWMGLEALSGVPGSVGATPIQNVGAYGQEISQTLASVHVWDRKLRGLRTFAAADCGFGYRTSRFKADPGRHVVLEVTLRLRQGRLGAPVAYAELADALGVEPGGQAPMSDVRAAVLDLRRRKGMVLDPDDHDTWSAGSFFTNPLIPAEHLPHGAPSWPQSSGLVKTSAAWLIEHAGFGRGYGSGAARVSTKHTLALTNRGGATTAELLELAREIRGGVRRRFGVTLVNEPVLVGCEV